MKLISRKKTLGFLLVTIILCSTFLIQVTVAEKEEEPDIETKVALVPVTEASSSDDYVDNKFEVVFINDDVNQTTIDYAKQEFNLEYNVTFEIRSIDKGTFDNATIINATSIKFEASNVMYGTNRTGEAIIRLYGSSPIGWVKLIIITITIITVKGETKKSESKEGPLEYDSVKRHPIGKTTVTDAKAGKTSTTTTALPEFPSGDLIASGMGIGILIIFLFRRKRTLNRHEAGKTFKTLTSL